MKRIASRALSYMGVKSSTPPNFRVEDRSPTTADYKTFTIGDIWNEKATGNLWVLTSVANKTATWTSISTAGGTAVTQIDADAGSALPAMGVVTLTGGSNITTAGAAAAVTINLDDNVTITGTFIADTVRADTLCSATNFFANDTIALAGNSNGVALSDGAGTITTSDGVAAAQAVGDILLGQGAGVTPAFGTAISTNETLTVTKTVASLDFELNKSITGVTTDLTVAYQLVLTDKNKVVSLSNAAAITLTIPTNATVAFPIGTEVIIKQTGAGQVTITPAGGVTLNTSGGRNKTYEQHSLAALIKLDTNTWVLGGDVTT